MAIDSHGNLYAADLSNYAIREISPLGEVSLYAGKAGESGTADGDLAHARFGGPRSIAIDGSGNLFVTDGNAVRKIDTSGQVSTLAGAVDHNGSTDATGITARFSLPHGIVIDPATNDLYIADTFNHVIRKVTPSGVVTTVVGQPGVGSFQAGALPGLIALPQYVTVSGDKLFISMDNAVLVVTPLP